MTRSAASSAAARSTRLPPVTAVSETNADQTTRSNGNGASPGGSGTPGAAPAQREAGRHREATLYHALAGAGAGDGRSLEQLREAARAVYQSSELPVWRRSGFWTTSLQSLELD